MSVAQWVRTRSAREKGILLGLLALVGFLGLWWLIADKAHIFVLAEVAHIAGIGALVFKLQRQRSASALSLRTQELTAIFLGVRLWCSFLMEYDIHTLLDFVTLLATGWVIYTVRVKLPKTYSREADSLGLHYVLVPCAALALLVHPQTTHHFANRVLWAFCVYLEAVSVLPQIVLFKNLKVVTDTFTSHYVFALGVARFFSCCHWILQFVEKDPMFINSLGRGLWPVAVLLAELLQTVILADFCYYYVVAMAKGHGTIRLPL